MINPTRTSADPVSSADTNELSSEALDKGGAGELAALTEDTTPASGDLFLMEDGATGALKKVDTDNMPGGTAAKADQLIDLPAGAWDFPTSNYAPLDTDTGTNGTIDGHRLDDTTEEFLLTQAQVCSDPDTGGTVTFEAYGYPVTAAASKNIKLKLYHSAKADGESWDAAFASKESGDLAVSGTQDFLNRFTWTETFGNLGWATNDHLRLKGSRIAPSANNLVGDWRFTYFRIRIPRS